jgi:hypothetical protein
LTRHKSSGQFLIPFHRDWSLRSRHLHAKEILVYCGVETV